MPLSDEEVGRMLPQQINTPNNRQALIQAGDNARDVGDALASMRLANPDLITQDNFQALINAGANAEGVGLALAKMRRTNPDLITQDNFQALINADADARGVGWALAQMRRTNPDLITPDNRQALINAGADAQSVGSALIPMYHANPNLITQDNFQALINAGADARGVRWALVKMSLANPALITPDNFQALINAGANAEQVAQDIINGLLAPPEPPEPLHLIAPEAIPEAPSSTLSERIIDAARGAGINISEIPDEFTCTITMEIMDQPASNVSFKTPNRCEYATLLQIAENQRRDPWTRAPMDPADVQVDEELKGSIQRFVADILVQLRQQEGHENDFPEFEMPDDAPTAGPAGP